MTEVPPSLDQASAGKQMSEVGFPPNDRYSIQDAGYYCETQDAKHETQNTRHKIQERIS